MSQNPTWHRRIPTINAERGYHSRLLEKLLQSTKALVNFLLKGPSTNAVRNKVRFYVTTPTSLMIQPGLCAHTVITLSEGPAIVAGFEAKLVEDDLRQDKCSIVIPLVCAKRQNSWPSKRVPTLLYLIIYVILGGVRQNLGNMWSVSKWTEKFLVGQERSKITASKKNK